MKNKKTEQLVKMFKEQIHKHIHETYRDNPYRRVMHLYNADFRGRELRWGTFRNDNLK